MKKNSFYIGGAIAVLALGIVLGMWFSPNAEGPGSHSHSDQTSETWTCSMHPQVQQPEFGACPICGMDLIPVATTGEKELAPNQVVLSKRAQALAMIRTEKVIKLNAGSGALSLTGRVTKNQNENRLVTSWFGGRVDKLRVSSVGEVVKRGRTIAELYSPEIYAAHNDLLLGNRQLIRLANAEPFARTGIEATVAAAKTKLRLLGMKDSEIARMAKADKPWTRVPMRSPFGGTVVKKRVSEGQYVKAGDPLLELSDLARLWVELDGYESDLPYLAVGAAVVIQVDSSKKKLKGTVTFIEPFVDQNTGTAIVRVEVEEVGGLRPGQHVTATVVTSEGTDADVNTETNAAVRTTLVIPRSAPMYAGRRSIVYVVRQTSSGSIYESRTVELGAIRGEFVVVKNGLKEGESVVSHGAFSVDADLQIRNGLSLMAAPDDLSRLNVSNEFREQLDSFLQAYLSVQKALATDDEAGAMSALQTLKVRLGAFSPKNDKVIEKWEQFQGRLRASLEDVPSGIVDQRVAFEGLSDALIQIVATFGNPSDRVIRVAHCPMAFDNRGANWIQSESEIRNAYFGSDMLSCGSIKKTVAAHSSSNTEPTSQPESQ